MRTKTLGDIYDRKNNSFDELRFFLASLVLYVHSYALLYGENGEKDFFINLVNYQIGLSTIAVYGFFVLSGFFMIQSLESNSSFFNYTKSRVLRIIPAFWMSLGLFSFLIIPIISTNIDIFSFKEGSSLYFFLNAGTFHLFSYSWTIIGAFPNNPVVDGINGSMWTLKHEIALYFILPLVIWFTYNKKTLLLLSSMTFVILAILNISTDYKLFNIPCCFAWVFSSNEYSPFIIFSAYFFLGALLYKYRDSIIVSKRYFIFFIILISIGIFFGKLKLILLISLPYLILVFGSFFKKKIFSKTGDYSYGMYIYAFPIQQSLIHFFKDSLNAGTLFFFSFLLTLMLSVLSWHFFEKKILKLKNISKNKSDKTHKIIV